MIQKLENTGSFDTQSSGGWKRIDMTIVEDYLRTLNEENTFYNLVF